MKRINNLYEKIYAVDNLVLADVKARKGKLKSYGVIKHDLNREQHITDLHESLKNKMFNTSRYHVFTITDPIEIDGDKKVLFTGSDILISTMEKVKGEHLPIMCKIIQEGEHYEFK